VFSDITDEIGLDFICRGRPTGDYRLPEIMGGGAAVFDADADGDLDLYFVDFSPPVSADTIAAPNKLYLQDEHGMFQLAAETGLEDTGYGMGCAVGDIDNDGDLDVYVTNWGPDALYRNEGGRFRNITADAEIENPHWGASAAFLDFDRDGWLDLFVTNYVDYDKSRVCSSNAGSQDYCSPKPFPGSTDRLFKNLGQGRFRDVSAAAGIDKTPGAGLGIVAADLDDDGWIDVYVANDGDPNRLWINQRDGTFLDMAAVLGAAVNAHGMAEAGMGVATGDVDGDGDLDLFVTHLMGETNTYYECLGTVGYDDATARVRLSVNSLDLTGFGTALFDYDLDGALDIAVINGGVQRRPRPLSQSQGFWRDYVEPGLLFHNDGSGVFDTAQDAAGSLATGLCVGRGLIPADIDRDGDLDLLTTQIAGPACLYRNTLSNDNTTRRLILRTRLPKLQREALGAKITIVSDRRRLVRHAIPPGGYLTCATAEIVFGLPNDEQLIGFEVRWPDGSIESFDGQVGSREVLLVKGTGKM
jgi:hypothetical protein